MHPLPPPPGGFGAPVAQPPPAAPLCGPPPPRALATIALLSAHFWLFYAAALALVLTAPEGEPLSILGGVLGLVGLLLQGAHPIAVGVWVHRAFAALPRSYRAPRALRLPAALFEPLPVVGLLAVPLVNLFWMFVCAQALVEAVNRISDRRGAPQIPAGRALVAPLNQLLFPPLAPWLWFRFARDVEAALRAAHEDATLAATAQEQAFLP